MWKLLLLWGAAVRGAEAAFAPPIISSPTKVSSLKTSRSPTFLAAGRGDFPFSNVRLLKDELSGGQPGGEEWHPMDPAYSMPQLLSALWHMIADGRSMVRGETNTVVFPQMQDQFTPAYLNRLMGHLDACKDVCDDFGTKTVLLPYRPNEQNPKVTGFTVKSYRNPPKSGQTNENGDDDDEDEYKFDYDPFWDDGNELDHSAFLGDDDDDDDDNDGSAVEQQNYPEIVNKVPSDDEEIVDLSKKWVDTMMSDMGICPFTSGPDLAGLPMGKVFYTVDRSTKMEDMYARYWKEVVRVEQNNEKDLSTTLLVAPEFCLENVELFENFSTTLTQPLEALGVEDLLQLVFFHPLWTFRDGGARSGMGSAANYARRSPWPMINILRTTQVRAAQKGIPTGLVYQQNEKTLTNVGTEQLETMLRLRDWSAISDVKVNRRDMEALRVAQDLQQSGTVAEQDQDLIHDSTPAANRRLDEGQVDGGDLLNVLLQALEKRLGLLLSNNESGYPQALSGAETSAAMMATDYVLEELHRVATSSPAAVPVATSTPVPVPNPMSTPDDDSPEEMDDEMSVLFGGAGILRKSRDDEDDDNFSTGLNPATFY